MIRKWAIAPREADGPVVRYSEGGLFEYRIEVSGHPSPGQNGYLVQARPLRWETEPAPWVTIAEKVQRLTEAKSYAYDHEDGWS
jgi:hypothetical protein